MLLLPMSNIASRRVALPRAPTCGTRIGTPLRSAGGLLSLHAPLSLKAPSVQLRAAAFGESSPAIDAKQVEKFVAAVKTSTWLSWWAQVILSVVSAVTLFFANAVKGAAQVSRVGGGGGERG